MRLGLDFEKYPLWVGSSHLALEVKATQSEWNFSNMLDNNGIDYYSNYPIYANGHWYFADFYIPDYHCIIEIDGGYHFTREQRIKDIERQMDLEENGYLVYRLSNNDCEDIDIMVKFFRLSMQRWKNEMFQRNRNNLKTSVAKCQ